MRSLVLLVCLAACGEDSSGGPYVPVDMIATSYKDALCKHLVMCGSFADQPTCLAANVPSNFTVDPNEVAAVLAGKMYYDGGKAAACFAAIAAATCDRTDLDSRTTPKACTALFRGAEKAGGACAFDTECISNTCSRTCGELTCCQGTCVGDTPPQTLADAQIGESCNFNGRVCVQGAYCDTTGTCAALKPANVACNSQSECDYGLYCTGSPTQTCKTLPTTGQPCAPDYQCRNEGEYCSSTTQMCTKVGLPGATCNSSSECSSYDRCDFTAMTCTTYPSVGQSCSAVGRCNDAGTYCDSTTQICTATKPAGDSCTTSTQCASAFCDTTFGLCAMPPTCT